MTIGEWNVDFDHVRHARALGIMWWDGSDSEGMYQSLCLYLWAYDLTIWRNL